ncbi:MAG: DUF2490 domain-containing protein [Saprospiraceae bacterium]|nr:DUF2490 domain-containing protein [Saprospiraceae bacterium]
MSKLLVLSISISWVSLLSGQQTYLGNWFQYVGNNGFSKNWNWLNEVQYRNYNFIGDLEQFLVRTGIGYNLTPQNNQLLMGYAFIQSKPYLNGTDERIQTQEHRLFQQFVTRQNFGRFFITHRYRFEQRFLEEEFRTRFRYLFWLQIPLNTPNITQKSVYISAFNELFIHGNGKLYDRNRLYAAVGYGINHFIRLELGVMSQIFQTNSRPQLQIALFNNLQLFKIQ